MTGTLPPRAPEERLRAFLVAEAEQAMAATDTQAELQRFHEKVGRARTSRRRTWIAATAAAAAAAVAVATVGGDLLRVEPDRVVEVAGTLEAPVPLPPSVAQDELAMSSAVGNTAFPAAGALWRLAGEDSVDRIDPESGAVTFVPLDVTAAAPFVEAAGLVWFPGSDADGEHLYALDPATNEIARRSERLAQARYVGSGPAGLWAVTGLRELTQVDPATGAVLRTVHTQQGLYDVHVGDGVVYSGAHHFGTGITVLDTATARTRIVLPEVAPGSIVLTEDGDLWVHDAARGALVRYDASSFREEAAIALGLPTSRGAQRDFHWQHQNDRRRTPAYSYYHDGAHPVVVGGSLYAAYNHTGAGARILRADARTGEVTGVVDVSPGGAVGPVTFTDGSLWIGWRRSDNVRRLALFE